MVPYKERVPAVAFGLSSQTGEKPRIAIIAKIRQINCVAHNEGYLIDPRRQRDAK